MFTPRLRTHLSAVLAIVAILTLSACGSIAAPSEAAVPSAGASAAPGEPLGAFPGVGEFAWHAESGAVPGFLQGTTTSLGEEVEVEIVQAAVATRGEEQVSVIAFGFPGASDEQAVDYFARVLDGMEDGFQAGAQRGLGGDAYVMTAAGQTVVVAPWGRRTDHLVFIFALGPTGPTEELATGILDAQG
jgi:hypothetical protein